MDQVILPPELERFGTEAVENGRYRDRSDVIRAGIGLLHRAEADRTALIASLEEAQAEWKRDGFFTAEEVDREMDEIIKAAERLQD